MDTLTRTDRTIAFLHRGKTLGDYPPVDQVVAAARTVAARPTP